MRFTYSLLCQCKYKLKLFKMDFMITLFGSSFCKCWWWCNIDFVKMTSVEDYDTPLGHEQHLREHEPLVFWILLKVMDQTWKLSWAGIESDGNVESNISQPWLLIGIKRPFLTDWQTTCFLSMLGSFQSQRETGTEWCPCQWKAYRQTSVSRIIWTCDLWIISIYTL